MTPLQAANEQLADVIERGELVFKAASCAMCHTDKENNGEPLAGGYAMKTDFGTVPNITPDRKTGIGRWSIWSITSKPVLTLMVIPVTGKWYLSLITA